MHLYLFDMDSVLVEPGGYRAALTETVNRFSRLAGLDDLAPSPGEIEVFEAAGITSEWDTAPIAIAAAFVTGQRPDYGRIAAMLAAEWQDSEYPCETAYRMLYNHLTEDQRRPGIRRAQRAGLSDDWLEACLLQSRNIDRSEVLRVFQQYTLGDEYEDAYGLKRTFSGPSTLLTYDRPVLSGAVPPLSVIYTARPSRAPRDVATRRGFAPEAELGARQVGLAHLPIIGFGSLQWLVEELGNGARSEAFVKPSPVHALAAIGAALGGPESEAILAGEAAVRGDWREPLRRLCAEGGQVTVFEDSARSIQGVRQAVELLGPNWAAHGIGIARPGPKREALARTADRVYNDLNAAMRIEIGLD